MTDVVMVRAGRLTDDSGVFVPLTESGAVGAMIVVLVHEQATHVEVSDGRIIPLVAPLPLDRPNISSVQIMSIG